MTSRVSHWMRVELIHYFEFICLSFSALAVYIRSPAAYQALQSFKILALPSSESLRQFTAIRNHDAGIVEDYIIEKSTDYKAFCEEIVKSNRPKPMGIGVLIFDEVKVMAKVMFSVKNEKFLGLAMSEEEMKGLHDIYQDMSSDKLLPAEYVLQYLWRDLTSNYDIIGPLVKLVTVSSKL